MANLNLNRKISESNECIMTKYKAPFMVYHQNTDELRIFHQNIRGLRNKTNELSSALYPDWPHVICLTEHHLNSLESENTNIDHYNMGAIYCRKNIRKGGVCIFVHNSINYSYVNMDKFCVEQIIEMCAIKIQSSSHNIYITAVYRAPSGNVLQFLNNLDTAIRTIFNSKVKIIVCGDININYLKETHMKKQLDSILLSYNLVSIIDFPTRSHNNSESLIDNIFIDPSQYKNHSVYPIVNGLSDHDAQLLIIKKPVCNSITIKSQL